MDALTVLTGVVEKDVNEHELIEVAFSLSSKVLD
jgi:hypothetical protein